jgi:hypothetical protein
LKWLGSIPRNGANEHVAEKYFHFYKANESCGEHNQKKQVFGAKETAVGYYLELHAAAIAFRAYSSHDLEAAFSLGAEGADAAPATVC